MTNSEMVLKAITNDQLDDGTIAAALDAIRADRECSLLDAVLEVARVHQSVRASQDLAEAIRYLAKTSPVCRRLVDRIVANCLNVDVSARPVVVVVEGDSPPIGANNVVDQADNVLGLTSITVGALWVKREASHIMVERQGAKIAKRYRKNR